MHYNRPDLAGKVALITGGARRVGACIARALHGHGVNLVLHYRRSEEEAHALQAELNAHRADSVMLIQSDLLHTAKLTSMIRTAKQGWGRLDLLVNNASSFYPTPIGTVSEEQWEDLMGSNLKAPFFLAQAAAGALRETRGTIINITDIHAERPLKTYNVYSTAKAGLVMLTKALARDLGPEIRVNAIAPGAILWPENNLDELTKHRIISRTALKQQGTPEDIARTVLFLVCDAPYISGEVIKVDGGRTLND